MPPATTTTPRHLRRLRRPSPSAGSAAAPGREACTDAYDAKRPRHPRRSANALVRDCQIGYASFASRRSAAVSSRVTPIYAYAAILRADDGNGNVRALVKADATTPTASAVVERYAYDGFGRELTGSGSVGSNNPQLSPISSSINSFRFSSKYFDPETGMNYYGYRFYAAGAGRWINRDPITEQGGLNVYSMINNCVPLHIDFNGLVLSGACKAQLGLLNQFPDPDMKVAPASWYGVASVPHYADAMKVNASLINDGFYKISITGGLTVGIGYNAYYWNKGPKPDEFLPNGYNAYTFDYVSQHEEQHFRIHRTQWSLLEKYVTTWDGLKVKNQHCAYAIRLMVNAYADYINADSTRANAWLDFKGSYGGHSLTQKQYDDTVLATNNAYSAYLIKRNEAQKACMEEWK